ASVPMAVAVFCLFCYPARPALHSFPTRRSADLVASYLMPVTCRLAELPALSRQAPATDPLAASGPEYVGVSQLSMSDVASVPLKSDWLTSVHQPLLPGARCRHPAFKIGAVASKL